MNPAINARSWSQSWLWPLDVIQEKNLAGSGRSGPLRTIDGPQRDVLAGLPLSMHWKHQELDKFIEAMAILLERWGPKDLYFLRLSQSSGVYHPCQRIWSAVDMEKGSPRPGKGGLKACGNLTRTQAR